MFGRQSLFVAVVLNTCLCRLAKWKIPSLSSKRGLSWCTVLAPVDPGEGNGKLHLCCGLGVFHHLVKKVNFFFTWQKPRRSLELANWTWPERPPERVCPWCGGTPCPTGLEEFQEMSRRTHEYRWLSGNTGVVFCLLAMEICSVGRWKRFARKLAVTVTTNFENKEITVVFFLHHSISRIFFW